MYAHIGWEDDADEDSDYRIDHVFMVNPATGKAYDVRGEFADAGLLISDWCGPISDAEIVPYAIEDLKDDMARGELSEIGLLTGENN
jgi:hypothetical protein